MSHDFLSISVAKRTDLSPDQNKYQMHMHADYEIFCFLSGDAEYIIEGNIYPLNHGDFLLIRPTESHYIHFLSKATYSRIVLTFVPPIQSDASMKRILRALNDREVGKFNLYSAARFDTSRILDYIKSLEAAPDFKVKEAYLTVILNEFSDLFENLKSFDDLPAKAIVPDILKYINTHLTEELSLSRICKHFFISKSQLNRSFKMAVGSTAWKYITEKRLLLAKSQIKNGGNPTKIYSSCGFADYTTFYRAYRAKFNAPPSK